MNRIFGSFLVTTLAVLPIALSVLPFNIYVVQALLLGVVLVASYLANKYFSFGGIRRPPTDPTSLPAPTPTSKD